MKIRVSYYLKPVPFRSFDWVAITSDYGGEESDPIGYGSTMEEAIADLYDQLPEGTVIDGEPEIVK